MLSKFADWIGIISGIVTLGTAVLVWAGRLQGSSTGSEHSPFKTFVFAAGATLVAWAFCFVTQLRLGNKVAASIGEGAALGALLGVNALAFGAFLCIEAVILDFASTGTQRTNMTTLLLSFSFNAWMLSSLVQAFQYSERHG
jgi:hypothetical protein